MLKTLNAPIKYVKWVEVREKILFFLTFFRPNMTSSVVHGSHSVAQQGPGESILGEDQDNKSWLRKIDHLCKIFKKSISPGFNILTFISFHFGLYFFLLYSRGK